VEVAGEKKVEEMIRGEAIDVMSKLFGNPISATRDSESAIRCSVTEV
jgi:hypothetical protein